MADSTTKFSFYPQLKKEIKINQFCINVIEFRLFNYVKISVGLFDTNNMLVDNRLYTLEGDDYTAWGEDDNYVVRYVKARLQQEGDY
jgi:hypothetical protein